MRNLKLTLSYDGTRYHGFSKPQPKGKKRKQEKPKSSDAAAPKTITPQNTISSKLAETISRLTGTPVELFCGAKTEPGVHALLQTVNFQTACPIPMDELCRSLNHYLPQDICIHTVTEVPERFHADLNARAQVYEYRIFNAPVMDPFLRRYALHVARPLDIAVMETAAKTLTGIHDFFPFSSGKGKKKKSTISELSSIQIVTAKNTATTDGDFPCEIRILMTENRFLYQMPRLVAGTLIDIGLGKRSPACIGYILAQEEAVSPPCPAHGLYLKEVSYEQ